MQASHFIIHIHPATRLRTSFPFLFHFCPSSVQLDASPYLAYIYGIVMILFLAIMMISAHVYAKKGVLPYTLKVSMIVFIFSFGYILHPMIFQILGQILGHMIMDTDIYPVSQRIVQIFIIIIGVSIYQILNRIIFPADLLFRRIRWQLSSIHLKWRSQL